MMFSSQGPWFEVSMVSGGRLSSIYEMTPKRWVRDAQVRGECRFVREILVIVVHRPRGVNRPTGPIVIKRPGHNAVYVNQRCFIFFVFPPSMTRLGKNEPTPTLRRDE